MFSAIPALVMANRWVESQASKDKSNWRPDVVLLGVQPEIPRIFPLTPAFGLVPIIPKAGPSPEFLAYYNYYHMHSSCYCKTGLSQELIHGFFLI